jgi:anti-sigma regulatory factor (Ser/Thr protein kinase)
MEPDVDDTLRGCRPFAHGNATPSGGGGVLTTVRGAEPTRIPAPVRLSGYHGETIMLGRWPLRTSLELGALSSAVPCARLHTRQVLWEWQQTSLIETAELVVSELMTNAIAATQASGSACPVRLTLVSDNSRTLILVSDGHPLAPQRIDPDGDTEGGRGLLLVDTLTSNWGWYATGQHRTAKVVWAELG